MWWRERRFPSIFEEMSREFEEFDRMIDRMMRAVRTWAPTAKPGEPLVYGFSLEVGPDGIPHFEQFGNVRPTTGGILGEGGREPYTSTFVDEDKNEFNITAEMPGINKEDLSVNVTEKTVELMAESKDRKYYKEIRIPVAVDPDSAKAKYNNGVLEVTLKLKEAAKPKGKSIKIE
ncbi:MAG: archaeal heat shock protein Hsp20 [Methanosarcinales archaeon]